MPSSWDSVDNSAEGPKLCNSNFSAQVKSFFAPMTPTLGHSTRGSKLPECVANLTDYEFTPMPPLKDDFVWGPGKIYFDAETLGKKVPDSKLINFSVAMGPDDDDSLDKILESLYFSEFQEDLFGPGEISFDAETLGKKIADSQPTNYSDAMGPNDDSFDKVLASLYFTPHKWIVTFDDDSDDSGNDTSFETKLFDSSNSRWENSSLWTCEADRKKLAPIGSSRPSATKVTSPDKEAEDQQKGYCIFDTQFTFSIEKYWESLGAKDTYKSLFVDVSTSPKKEAFVLLPGNDKNISGANDTLESPGCFLEPSSPVTSDSSREEEDEDADIPLK